MHDNKIVTAQDKFLTDRLNTHAANKTLSAYPYAKAVKDKGASGGLEEICKRLGKQIEDDKCQAAKKSIEASDNGIFKDIKQKEKEIATLQTEISDFRKQNAKNHKETQSDFCKEYHQKHLDGLFDILTLSTEALENHKKIPDTSHATVTSIADNKKVAEVLQKTLLEYEDIAVSRYSNMQNRIANLKDMSQNTEIENIDTKTNTGRVKAMSIYLSDKQIDHYNVFASMYEAATSSTDKALMSTADILLNDARLKTDLETEIASTTKQIALLITEHNDITLPSKKDKDMLKKELSKLKSTDESLEAKALKMIDKIAVEQKANAANSGNFNSASAQGGNSNTKTPLNIDGIAGYGSQSKLTSDDTAITATLLRKDSQQQYSSLSQRGH